MLKKLNLSLKNLKGNFFTKKLNSPFYFVNCHKFNDNFLNGSNTRYAEQMYASWKKDPKSVHISWASYFENLEDGLGSESFKIPPSFDSSWSLSHSNIGEVKNESMQLMLLIRSYQKSGYLKAQLDPLNMMDNFKFPIYKNALNLDYTKYGFKESDLDREFLVKTDFMKGILAEEKPQKLRNIVDRLEKAYCSKVAVEFQHISSREEIAFITEKMENDYINWKMSKSEKIRLYDKLAWACLFEKFLEVKFTTKRFGLEGLESMISGLYTFFREASGYGVKDITLGMAHRGRLNVLANVFKKPIVKIFQEFMGHIHNTGDENYERTGDVKYHLGHKHEAIFDGNKLSMEILSNPSHLEAVNPVVMGNVRAKQHFNKDSTREE